VRTGEGEGRIDWKKWQYKHFKSQNRNGLFEGVMTRQQSYMGYASEHVLSETDGKGYSEPEISTDFRSHFPDDIFNR
jgi:hypothetical protein